ncbi:MAG: hypothetical protein J6I64_08675 [Lachnospiraceae bacterium]|nr:hypothetical protein [Lachnospiraceae bacterium]
MKNKAPLPLMEQLIMILVFALTAALCLQGFALANRLSQCQETKEHAVIQAQNTAEQLKHTAGDYALAAKQWGGFWDGHTWTIPYDTSWHVLTDGEDAVYTLQATPVTTGHPLLGSASIQVFHGRDILFELTAAWQEGNPDEHP